MLDDNLVVRRRRDRLDVARMIDDDRIGENGRARKHAAVTLSAASMAQKLLRQTRRRRVERS